MYVKILYSPDRKRFSSFAYEFVSCMGQEHNPEAQTTKPGVYSNQLGSTCNNKKQLMDFVCSLFYILIPARSLILGLVIVVCLVFARKQPRSTNNKAWCAVDSVQLQIYQHSSVCTNYIVFSCLQSGGDIQVSFFSLVDIFTCQEHSPEAQTTKPGVQLIQCSCKCSSKI